MQKSTKAADANGIGRSNGYEDENGIDGGDGGNGDDGNSPGDDEGNDDNGHGNDESDDDNGPGDDDYRGEYRLSSNESDGIASSIKKYLAAIPTIDITTIKRPPNAWLLFCKLERLLILQKYNFIVDKDVLFDSNHFDPVEHPRPWQYKSVNLPR